MLALVAAALVLARLPGGAAMDNGLAMTPPMGWSTWNTFRCNISEALIRQSAESLVSSGLAAAGYKCVAAPRCDRSRWAYALVCC